MSEIVTVVQRINRIDNDVTRMIEVLLKQSQVLENISVRLARLEKQEAAR